jgi:hypothetical protein
VDPSSIHCFRVIKEIYITRSVWCLFIACNTCLSSGSIPRQSMWYMWWVERHRDGFSPVSWHSTVLLLLLRHHLWEDAEFVIACEIDVLWTLWVLFQYFGIPQHYGLFYAMGAALMMEGVLSACYHVCPNHSNFQFGKWNLILHISHKLCDSVGRIAVNYTLSSEQPCV